MSMTKETPYYITLRLQAIRHFIETVVTEQKEAGGHGDSTYISNGQAALQMLTQLEADIRAKGAANE